MIKKRLNVLLVEDDPDYVPLVQAWLAACPDAEFVVNWTDTLLTGVQRLALGGIDAILLDLNLPDSSGADTFHGVHANAQGIPIVLLSASDSEALSMSLVLSGAQDYLVKEACDGRVLSRALLHGVLRQSARSTGGAADQQEKSRLVGLLGAKGGVGTSTLACTLAAEVGRVTLQDTLLADLDLHANSLSFLLGLPARRTIADAISNMSHLDRACWNSIVTTGPDNLHVLESSDLMGAAGPTPEKLVQLFHFVRLYYAWTVLDLGRLSPAASAMLPILSHIVVVTTDHVASLNPARRMLELTRQMEIGAHKIRLAVSITGREGSLSQRDMERMFAGVPTVLLPESSAEMKEAMMESRLVARTSPYRSAVSALAHRLAGVAEAAPARESAISHLLTLGGRLKRAKEPAAVETPTR